MGGQPGKYYLVYLGKQTPTNWNFEIPKPPTGSPQFAEGSKFTVDVLDTWNMTVSRVPGDFTLKKSDDDTYADKDRRSIALPGNPYMAIRVKWLKN